MKLATMKLAQIASTLDARLENGSPETEITGVAGIEEAGPDHITFVANPKYAAAARTTKAAAVIVAEDFPAIPSAMLRSKNPYLAFAKAIGAIPSAAEICAGSASDGRGACVGAHRRGRAHWTLRGDRRRRRDRQECGAAGPCGHLSRGEDR